MLRNAVLFLILAPYDNEQSDLIHRVGEEKTLDEIPLYRYIVNALFNAKSGLLLSTWPSTLPLLLRVLLNISSDFPVVFCGIESG